MHVPFHVPAYVATTISGNTFFGSFGDLLDTNAIDVLVDSSDKQLFVCGKEPVLPRHSSISVLVCLLTLLVLYDGRVCSHQLPLLSYTREKSAFCYRVLRPFFYALNHAGIAETPLRVVGSSDRFLVEFVDVGVVIADLACKEYILADGS